MLLELPPQSSIKWITSPNLRLGCPQNMTHGWKDEKINKLKQNLLGNPEAYNTFVIKNGILCKQFNNKKDGMAIIGPYIPDSIIYAVAAYVHRRNLHSSISQTIKEFKAYYYHPVADRIIKELCKRCITCTQTRNKEKRNMIDNIR